jgi:hypothetical protein
MPSLPELRSTGLTRPLAPSRISRLLRWSVSWRYPESGDPYPVPAPSWEPPPLDADAVVETRAYIAELETWLAPVDDPQWLGSRVKSWVAQAGKLEDLDPGAMAMVVSDWFRALKEFPKRAIDAAAQTTIRRGRRLTIADAVDACLREVAEARAELASCRRLVDPKEQERARRREIERDAEEKREAERAEWNRQNPGLRPFQDALRRVMASAERERDDAQGSA